MKSSSAVHCISLVLTITVAVLCGCNQPEQETPQNEVPEATNTGDSDQNVVPEETDTGDSDQNVVPEETDTGDSDQNVVPEETDAGDSDQNVVPEETDTGDSDRHQVRVENTDASGIRVVDARDQSIQTVDWLESRRQKQLATVDQFNVFHEFRFVDRQPESGIQFRHFAVDCATVKYKPVHYDHGNGMAIADVDNDGLLDIYFVTQIGRNELWRNLGGGTFEDITDSAGVAVMDRTSVAASFADIDNDGDADLYVTTVRDGNVLFANDGGGKFEDISDQSGLGYRGHSSSAVFFDFDRDGLLDVFLSNVGVYTTDKLINATAAGDGNQTYYLGLEDGFAGHLKPDRNEPSILFKNMGENRFQDVSKKMNLVDTGWSGAASPIDGNGDGWPDLYVLNMQGNDEYYENDGGEKFIRKSREVFAKTPWGAMGIKVFDYNNDGFMDIFVTDMHSDMSSDIGPDHEKQKSKMYWTRSYLRTAGTSIWGNAVYRNDGQGKFEEVSDQIGAENYWPWGLSVGDLNADGFDDVFIASSMNYPFRYGVNTVLLNNQGERFLDSEFILGVEPRRDGRTATLFYVMEEGMKPDSGRTKIIHNMVREGRSGTIEVWGSLGSRSSVIFDLDDDGDLDIVTNDFHSEPMVLVSNLTENKDIHFLKVRLVGTKSNRDGLGARVTVHTPSGALSKNHDGQSGHLSQSRYDLYFGLGDDDAVESIEVTWPSGETQIVSDGIVPGQLITIQEP